MSYQQRPNSGSLFRNDRKEEDNHPDHTGTCLIDGTEYYISAWVKEGRNGGRKYFSLSFKPKVARDKAQGAIRNAVQPRPEAEDFDDSEIPF